MSFCPNCQTMECVHIILIKHPFRECGLENVYFDKVRGITCPKCQWAAPLLSMFPATLDGGIVRQLCQKLQFFSAPEFEAVISFIFSVLTVSPETAEKVGCMTHVINGPLPEVPPLQERISEFVENSGKPPKPSIDQLIRVEKYKKIHAEINQWIATRLGFPLLKEPKDILAKDVRRDAEAPLRELAGEILEHFYCWTSRSELNSRNDQIIFLSDPDVQRYVKNTEGKEGAD